MDNGIYGVRFTDSTGEVRDIELGYYQDAVMETYCVYLSKSRDVQILRLADVTDEGYVYYRDPVVVE